MISALAMPPPNVQQNTEPPAPPDGNTVILRQEVWGPTEELESGQRYVMRMPKALTWDEIVFDVAVPGGLLVSVQVYVNGITLFPAPKQISGGGILQVPRAQWSATYQAGSIPAFSQVVVILTVSPAGIYSNPWYGLGMAFVKA